MSENKDLNFESLYGELSIFGGEEVEIIEPRMVKKELDYYEVDKRVAKSLMSEIGMVSEYFSRRLYSRDKEIWGDLLNKSLEHEGGSQYLSSINLVVTDQVICNYFKDETYEFQRVVEKIIDESKDSRIYLNVDDFYLNVLLEEDEGKGILYITTHPNFDIRIYLGVCERNKNGDITHLYFNQKPSYQEDLRIVPDPEEDKEELNFFNLDLDYMLSGIGADELLEFQKDKYSVNVSLEELFDLFGEIDIFVAKDDLEDLNEIERKFADEGINYINENYSSYEVTRGLNFLKRAISITDYELNDVLEVYTKLLFSEESERVKMFDIMNLAEKISENDFHAIQIES